MIDAHLHLQDERLGELDALMVECQETGIHTQFVNGTRPEDWESVAQLAKRYPGRVRPNYGLHPWFVQDAGGHWHEKLKVYLDDDLTVGVGEIGLDKWIRDHDLEKQKEAFGLQLQWASERALPASIHCLQAWGHLLGMLKEAPPLRRGFLLHSYGGPEQMVEDFVDLGAYFSVSGYFFHARKRAHLEMLLQRVPRERLLLETDAPDMILPAELQRFTAAAVNHPGNLGVVYEEVAKQLGLSLSVLAGQLRENAERLFGIDLSAQSENCL